MSVRKNASTVRNVRLPSVGLGQATTRRSESPANGFELVVIPFERHARDLGHDVACEVVRGGAQAARRHDGFETAGQMPKRQGDGRGFVGDRDDLVHFVSLIAESTCQPRSVGVDELATGELRTYAEDCYLHREAGGG